MDKPGPSKPKLEPPDCLPSTSKITDADREFWDNLVEFVSDEEEITLDRLLEDSDFSGNEQDVEDRDVELQLHNFAAPEIVVDSIEEQEAPPETVNDALSRLLNEFKRAPISEAEGPPAKKASIGRIFDEGNADADPIRVPENRLVRAKMGTATEKAPDPHDIAAAQTFGGYMALKKAKLRHQVNGEEPHDGLTSNIFSGISVFVNGYTEPPALIIRELMTVHGGEYHCYYEHGRTTYVIASSLASVKVDKLRQGEIFIKPEWITDSIARGYALPHIDYVVNEKDRYAKGTLQRFFAQSKEDKEKPKNPAPNRDTVDARDPDFIFQYYARSRLHLISTLAQDMKDFVADLKSRRSPESETIDLRDLGRFVTSERRPKEDFIFHVDLDCFFVSVALRSRPECRGKPVAITHSKGVVSNSMSEIASCSYEARACGVKNGMLVKDALEQCSRLVFLPYQFEDYTEVSKIIYTILSRYTLDLRAVSCDEMYLNCTELCRKFSITDPKKLAEHMRTEIREKTGCPASVGIGPTSLIARLATRRAKPDGVYWVPKLNIADFIAKEKIRDIPGIGYQSLDKIKSFFGDTERCSELQAHSLETLEPLLGKKVAQKLYNQCRGIEEDPPGFWEIQQRKSVSCDINYGIRFTEQKEAMQLLSGIGFELERKLNRCKMLAGNVTLKLLVRSADAPVQTAKFMGHGRCDAHTKSAVLPMSTNNAKLIITEIVKLYNKIAPLVEDLRGVGVQCSKLKSADRQAMSSAVAEMFKPTSQRKPLQLAGRPKKDEERKRKRHFYGEDGDEDMLMRMEDFNRPHKTSPPLKNRHICEHEGMRNRLEPPRSNQPLAPPAWMPKCTKDIAFGSQSSLNGVTDDEGIEAEFEKILIEEPTRESVVLVARFFCTTARLGNLQSLTNHSRTLLSLVGHRRTSHAAWFQAAHLILNEADAVCAEYYGAPMMLVDSLEHLNFGRYD